MVMRALVLVLALVGCKREAPAETDETDAPYVPPAWDPPPAALDCADDAAAPLLDAALANAGIGRDDVGYSSAEYAKASYADYLDDVALLPWFRDLQAAPLKVPCFAAERVETAEHFAALGRPATGAMWAAMDALAEPVPAAPLDPGEGTTWDDAVAVLLDATGDDGPIDASALPDGLADALVPVLLAMAEVIEAWGDVEDAAPEPEDDLARWGHGGVLVDTTNLPYLSDAEVQQWLVGADGPRRLYGPTLRLLHALETADLDRFAGQGAEGVLLSFATRKGEIRVAGPGVDEPGPLDALLYVDLGGDDVYVHAAGANADGMPLAVMVDLGGADTYGYVEVPSAYDGDRLVSDEDGRYRGDTAYGPVSFSRIGRQGSGRFGVGVLLDRGGGADRYTSLRMSQGWGHLGVGVLADDGGDDAYRGEAGVQGAASMGIGLLVDGGGADVYETYADAQGFGYVQGAGLLIDAGDGNDRYWSDHGDPTLGGDPLYYSPQMPKTANSSFTQGAGFGRRADSDGGFLSGGFGLLRDGGGDDAYTAGVFAQGTGYWQGFGALSDAGGDDTYDAFWYVHGAAAHYAIGALLDGGGNDVVAGTLVPKNMHLGAGHDFSVGVYVDEGGDDTYRTIGLAAGASNCQGIGLFADNAGADTYEALSTYGYGLGNQSSECNSGFRATVHSIGLFMDGGGADAYTWPSTEGRQPADDTTFGIAWSDGEAEHGGAVDGTGETALHPGGRLP